jgi:hypothetical protein
MLVIFSHFLHPSHLLTYNSKILHCIYFRSSLQPGLVQVTLNVLHCCSNCIIKNSGLAGLVAQVGQRLPSKLEILSSNVSTVKKKNWLLETTHFQSIEKCIPAWRS